MGRNQRHALQKPKRQVRMIQRHAERCAEVSSKCAQHAPKGLTPNKAKTRTETSSLVIQDAHYQRQEAGRNGTRNTRQQKKRIQKANPKLPPKKQRPAKNRTNYCKFNRQLETNKVSQAATKKKGKPRDQAPTRRSRKLHGLLVKHLRRRKATIARTERSRSLKASQ